MAKKITPINRLQLKSRIAELRLKPSGGIIVVGGEGCEGLHIQVKGNSACWVLSYAKGKTTDKHGRAITRRVKTALYDQRSSYPLVTLERARKRARELREMLLDGKDPKEVLQAARLDRGKNRTFQQCAIDFIDNKRAEWKNGDHAAQWTQSLEAYVFPLIGKMSIADIDTEHVLNVLRQKVTTKEGGTDSFWNSKTETASRVRGRIEAILSWAEYMRYRPEGKNPASWKDGLKNALPAPSKVQKIKKHHPALPHARIGEFMAILRKLDEIIARALEFSILTAARSGETMGALWSEIDLEGKMWTIPANRMKAGKEHQVPLSNAAIELLQALPRFKRSDHNNGLDYVFPAPRGGKLSPMGSFKLLRRVGFGEVTQHGFRSTFREWAGEVSNHSREVIEHALAHKLKDKAEASYQRGTLWPKRIKLMEDWANYCDPELANNVISIRKGAAI